MQKKKIYIENKEISSFMPPYIIGKYLLIIMRYSEFYKLIDVAKSCGASAVKIQTYTADT